MNVKLISLPCICRDEHCRAPENEASIKLLPCILPSNCYHAYTTFIFMCIHKLLCNFLQWLDCFTYTPYFVSDKLCDSAFCETCQKCRREPAVVFFISGGRPEPAIFYLKITTGSPSTGMIGSKTLCTFFYAYLVKLPIYEL